MKYLVFNGIHFFGFLLQYFRHISAFLHAVWIQIHMDNTCDLYHTNLNEISCFSYYRLEHLKIKHFLYV